MASLRPNIWLPLFLLLTLLQANEPIEPIPLKPDYDPVKAKIGKQLFFDPMLSRDRSVSCASCHDVYKGGGADSRSVSLGVNARQGNIQSPTVFNSRYNFKQFWNGRANDLYEQASGPMHNPKEFDMNQTEMVKRINANTNYAQQLQKLYGPGKVNFPQIIDTIVEFEKALTTPNSLFDRYLRGEATLSTSQMRGYLHFKEFGCITCHNGINIGGNSFQRMGTVIPYKYDHRFPDRYQEKNRAAFKNVFKVPTLRNIALTAPYFHDASSATLTQAIKTMSYHNLGFELNDEQTAHLVEFLKTLTGETPAILKE